MPREQVAFSEGGDVIDVVGDCGVDALAGGDGVGADLEAEHAIEIPTITSMIARTDFMFDMMP